MRQFKLWHVHAWSAACNAVSAYLATEYFESLTALGVILFGLGVTAFISHNSFFAPYWMAQRGLDTVSTKWPDDIQFPQQRGGEIDGDSSS